MLDSSCEVIALEAKRAFFKVNPVFEEKLGGNHILQRFLLFRIIRNLSRSWLFGYSPASTHIFEVDNAEIAVEKESKREDHDFISTNDCLFSWGVRTLDAELSMMVVDFRDRIPGIGSSLAGNYENCLIYTKV
jgi:hypothetical protein